jgi:hypothetical protein
MMAVGVRDAVASLLRCLHHTLIVGPRSADSAEGRPGESK